MDEEKTIKLNLDIFRYSTFYINMDLLTIENFEFIDNDEHYKISKDELIKLLKNNK